MKEKIEKQLDEFKKKFMKSLEVAETLKKQKVDIEIQLRNNASYGFMLKGAIDCMNELLKEDK